MNGVPKRHPSVAASGFVTWKICMLFNDLPRLGKSLTYRLQGCQEEGVMQIDHRDVL
jgi:hypothetical protein